MPEYIRTYVPGGTFFFTVVTNDRTPLFSSERARASLREAILAVQEERPFTLVATVLLPQHWHCIWALPEGDQDHSKRWGIIKSRFSKLWLVASGSIGPVSDARTRHRECGIWQKRFWEHRIRNEQDFIHHVNYIHFNPVKHGLVRCPHAWPFSSFHRWVEQGLYKPDWLCDCSDQKAQVPDSLQQGDLFGE